MPDDAACRQWFLVQTVSSSKLLLTLKPYCCAYPPPESVELRTVRVAGAGPGAPPTEESVRAVSAPPRLGFVPHYGYVSMFPLIMRQLPPSSAELGQQLELLRNESLCWTRFGLRSLARSSSLYARCVGPCRQAVRENVPRLCPYGATGQDFKGLAKRRGVTKVHCEGAFSVQKFLTAIADNHPQMTQAQHAARPALLEGLHLDQHKLPGGAGVCICACVC